MSPLVLHTNRGPIWGAHVIDLQVAVDVEDLGHAGHYLEERQGFPIKLNIGCGRDVRDGWVNADLHPVDDDRVMSVDADSACWPWPDRTFCQIDALHLIEHLDHPMTFLAECWRVLLPGGTLTVSGPHFTSRNVVTDLTHRRGLSSETFLWAAGMRSGWIAHDSRPWSDVFVQLEFDWWCMVFGFTGLTNLSPFLMKLYEATPWRIFPARNVVAELTK